MTLDEALCDFIDVRITYGSRWLTANRDNDVVEYTVHERLHRARKTLTCRETSNLSDALRHLTEDWKA